MKKDISYIEQIVCAVRGQQPERLQTRTRVRDIKETRQVVIYFSMKEGHTYANSGGYYGLDHATAIHARTHINNMIDTEKQMRDEVDIICGVLKDEELYKDWLVDKMKSRLYRVINLERVAV